MVDALAHLAVGFRLALILFAVMSLLSTSKWSPEAMTDARRMAAQRLNATGWGVLAAAVLVFSPAHASWLLGHPVPPLLTRALDVGASCLACFAFIKCIAFRGLMRGLSWPRVRHGIRVNLGVMVAVVGAACLIQ